MNKKYYSSIDLLRFLAAVAVAFFFHYAIVFGDSPVKDTIVGDFLNTYGGYVVELFFVISGFVMFNAFGERIREGKTVFTKYLVYRIIRLYPAVIVSVVFIWAMMWIGYAVYGEPITENANVSLIAILLNITGLNGGTVLEAAGMSVNGPSWYVSILMVCYLLFYGIIKMCKRSRGAENVCFVLIIVIGIFLYFNPINAPLLLMSSARGYVFFFTGVFLAQLQEKTNIVGRILLCIVSIGLVAMFVFAYKYDLIVSEGLDIGFFIICPIVVFFINFIPLDYICSNIVVKFLGGISFGIFLWNLPVYIGVIFIGRVLCIDFDYGSLMTYLIIIGINTLFGALSHILLDKLFVNKIKHIREENENKKQQLSQQ